MPISTSPVPPRPAGYDKKVALVLQGGGALAATRPGCTRRWPGPTICLTGWPASRSAPLTPRSSPAMHPASAWRSCGSSGKASPRRQRHRGVLAGRARGRLDGIASSVRPAHCCSANPASSRRARRWNGSRAEAGQLLRHRRAEGHAGSPGGFRPDQCPRHAVQRRRGECPHRQLRLFRQCRDHHPAGARDGQRCPAARLPGRSRSMASTTGMAGWSPTPRCNTCWNMSRAAAG